MSLRRFNILKHRNFYGMYAIFDNEAQEIVCTVDTLEEARQTVEEFNFIIDKERIVDEAMFKLFG